MEFKNQFEGHLDVFCELIERIMKNDSSNDEIANYTASFMLFDLLGNSSDLKNSTNAFMVSDNSNDIINDKVYIDIYPAVIEIGSPNINGGRPIIEINTECFTDVSDEQIFMQSTLQDLSLFDTRPEVLKMIIQYSLMAMVTYRKLQDGR